MIQENIARARKILHELETRAIFSCVILNANQYYIIITRNQKKSGNGNIINKKNLELSKLMIMTTSAK